jgi:S1-C subfamily serine protease
VTAQGLFAGIQNGRQFVSISSILVAASKILATDLSVTFVPARDLDIKSMRLVDAGLSIPCMRATGFIIYAEGRKYGTGFLCKWKGKRFVITNYHVLGLLKDAQEAWIEFRALSPVLRVKLDPSKVHLADQVLDFAVIAISESSLRDLKFVEPLELSLEESIEAVALQVLGYPSG